MGRKIRFNRFFNIAESVLQYKSSDILLIGIPYRASESVVFNSDQKMALSAVHVVIC